MVIFQYIGNTQSQKGFNDRLDRLERTKWQSKLFVFWGSFTGAVVTIGGFLLAKIKIF
jgi:hypothetical protein